VTVRGPARLTRTLLLAVLLCLGPSGRAAEYDPRVAAEILRLLPRWPSARVEIPSAVYHRFVELRKLGPPRPDPPVPYIISTQVHKLVIDGKSAELSVSFHLQVLDPRGSAHIPLLPRSLAFQDIRINGKPAKLIPLSERLVPLANNAPALQQAKRAPPAGWLALKPENEGAYVVAARAVLTSRSTGDTGAFAYPRCRSARTELRVTAKRALDVRSPYAVGTIAGTTGSLALRPGSQMAFRWRPLLARAEHEPVLTTRCQAACDLGPGTIVVNARLDVTIRRGAADRLVLELPPTADRVSVSGRDLRRTGDLGRGRTVHLRGPVRGRTRIGLRFEVPRRRAKGPVTLDYFGVRGAVPTGGRLIVSNSGGGELLEEETERLEAEAFFGLPEELLALSAEKPLLAYSIRRGRWRLACNAVHASELPLPPTIIEKAEHVIVCRKGGNAIGKSTFEVSNSSRQFLRVRLPAGSKLRVAVVDEQAVAVTPGAPGAFILPLKKSITTMGGLVSFPVELVYTTRIPPLRENGTFRANLPRVDAPIAYTTCRLYLPEEIHVSKWSGPLEHVKLFTTEREHDTMVVGRSHRTGERPPEPTTAGSGQVTFVTDAQSNAEVIAANRYRAAVEAYNKKEFGNAKVLLENTVRLFPKSTWSQNARKLLDNVRLALDQPEEGRLAYKAAPKSGKTRARMEQLSRSIRAGDEKLLDEQKALLTKGEKLAQQGQSAAAAEALSGSIVLGHKLRQRGQAGKEQAALMSRAQTQLKPEMEKQKKLLAVEQQLARLKDKLRQTRRAAKDVNGADEQTDDIFAEEGDETVDPKGTARKEKDSTQALEVKEKMLHALEDLAQAGERTKEPARPAPATLSTASPGKNVFLQRARQHLRGPQDTFANAPAQTDVDRLAAKKEELHELQEKLDESVQKVAELQQRAPLRKPRKPRPKVTPPPVQLPQITVPPQKQDPDQTVTRTYVVPTNVRGPGYGGGGGGQSFNGDKLAEMVKSNIQPGTWAPTDGGFRYQVRNGKLVVTGGRQVQKQVADVLGNLAKNWGQNIDVPSFNTNVSKRLAVNAGVRWIRGNNDVTYGVVDEGTLRALAEFGQRRQRDAAFHENPMRNPTAVGTRTVIANNDTITVEQSADTGNWYDYNDNRVFVPHDKYLLISNNGYVTAVGGTQTYHWTERVAAKRVIIEVAPKVDLPLVGRVFKFEKTLLAPEDEPVLEARYEVGEAE